MLSIEQKAQKIFSLYDKYGSNDYIGEEVSQLEHATQCAMLAEQQGYTSEVILGAFLHDIGHLVGMDSGQERMVTEGLVLGVQQHDVVGEKFLQELAVPAAITRFVKGHVDAKRYLTYKNPAYYDGLSEASKMTLQHQGGPMSAQEAAEFETDSHIKEILTMRQWDEQAKVPNLKIDPIHKYKDMFISCMATLRK